MGERSKIIAELFDNNKNIKGIEIGVRYGKNAEQLLMFLPNLHLTLVDPWRKPPPGDSYYNSGDGIADRPEKHFKRAYKQTLERVSRFNNRVRIFVKTSSEAAKILSNEQFDFIFIDGDHSYDGVKQDILLWLPMVKPGGFLCGHDYGHPNIQGVKKAVDELLTDFIVDNRDMVWIQREK